MSIGATLSLDCRNFRGVYEGLNSRGEFFIHPLDFRRAIFTLGSPSSSDLDGRGWRRSRFRRSMGNAVTEFLLWDGGNLRLADDFAALDRTEKGGVSFWMGSAITFLVAQNRLAVPWLAHVDLLLTAGVLSRVGDTRVTPDFAGFGQGGGWHVIESKGRSSGYDTEVVRYAKEQASKVKQVSGAEPQTSSACVVSFSPAGTSVLLDDPKPSLGDQQWTIEPKPFLRYYYSGIRHLLATSRTDTVELNGRWYLSTLLEDPACCGYFIGEGHRPKLHIGLLENIFARPELAQRFVEGLKTTDGIGPDGIAVFE